MWFVIVWGGLWSVMCEKIGQKYGKNDQLGIRMLFKNNNNNNNKNNNNNNNTPPGKKKIQGMVAKLGKEMARMSHCQSGMRSATPGKTAVATLHTTLTTLPTTARCLGANISLM